VLEDANAIKKIFAARPGYVLMQADYSQAELRTLASCSLDPALIDIYDRGLDAHTATAAKVYGIDLDAVTKAMRSNAKTVNFGIVYGMSWESLLQKFVSAGNTEDQARAFYDGHKKTFSKVWRWLDKQEEIIRRVGEQTTFFGRTRRYSEIDNHAIRQAYNFPIQSLASDLTLLSLVRCAKALRARKLPARVCLTVHDSIIFEIKMEAFWEVAQLVHDIMSGIHFDWMRVPMTVDMEVGLNWGQLKAVDMNTLTIAS
jgi:DNA polymerase-1